MRKLIITADDYGMCQIVNDAIDDCIEAGLVTSTNVLVNMEKPSAAAKHIGVRMPACTACADASAGLPVSAKSRNTDQRSRAPDAALDDARYISGCCRRVRIDADDGQPRDSTRD